MAAWNFVTTNSGGNPDGYDAEDWFPCAFGVRRPQLEVDRQSAIFKRRHKRKFAQSCQSAQSAQSKTFNFTRSDIGNINDINLNERSSKWGTARTFNNIHALTGIGSDNQTFDVDGNLTGSHASHTLAWDEAGMMKQSTVPNGSNFGIEGTTEYGYDADRKRVWKRSVVWVEEEEEEDVTVYVYAGPNCIAEYPAGTAAASPTQEYVYAQEIDSLVLLVRGGGSDKYTITRNQQWSVTALAELASGTIVERYTYDHFGKRTILEPNGTSVRSASSYGMHYGYTSRRHDAETDLMYFRARYYDPHTAEFLSPDPLEYVDGMSLFRGYFVIAGRDPFGKCKCEITTDLHSVNILGRFAFQGKALFGGTFTNLYRFEGECKCCEYRQYIRINRVEAIWIRPGRKEQEGVDILPMLGSRGLIPLWSELGFPEEFTEDTDLEGRSYGYRKRPEFQVCIYSEPDRQTGCKYRVTDRPNLNISNIAKLLATMEQGVLNGHKLKVSFDAQFLSNIIDVCSETKNNVIRSRVFNFKVPEDIIDLGDVPIR